MKPFIFPFHYSLCSPPQSTISHGSPWINLSLRALIVAPLLHPHGSATSPLKCLASCSLTFLWCCSLNALCASLMPHILCRLNAFFFFAWLDFVSCKQNVFWQTIIFLPTIYHSLINLTWSV